MARQTKKMSEETLSGIVDSYISDAKIYGGQYAKDRELALKFREGEVDFPASGEKRSEVVSRDVADIHGLILPGLMKMFFSSDELGQYEPTRKEHEDYSQQATDLANYVLLKECQAERHLRDGFDDGLLLGNGVVKHWWDTTPEYTTNSFTKLNEGQFRLLFVDETGKPYPETDIEVVDHETQPDPAAAELGVPSPSVMDMGGGAPPPVPLLHDVTIKRKVASGRLRFSGLPPEEFVMVGKVLDETCRFCAHVQRKMRSDLIAEGYKKDLVDAIPAYSIVGGDYDSTKERDPDNEESDLDSKDRATQFVEVFECYPLVDYDGDGIAERRRIVMAGTTGARSILANEEWGDDLPFTDIIPEPRAHTRRGRSIFDLVADLQRIKTVALRGILDSMYASLHPQKTVKSGAVEVGSMDELINPTFDGIVMVTDHDAVRPIEKEFIAPQIFPVLEYLDQVGEKRTGVSQRSSALDIDALANQSATAVNAATAAAQVKVEEYARNIAFSLKRLFGCILKLMVKHQDRPKTIRLRGKLVEVDPRAWDANMDVTVNVGLGTGSRDRDVAVLNMIAQKLEAVIMKLGPSNPLAGVDKLFDVYRKMTEGAGVRNADAFFPVITPETMKLLEQQAAQQKPDPKMAEIQANSQARMAELQAKVQVDQIKAQADAQAEQDKLAKQMMIEQKQAEADMAVERMKTENAAALQARDFAFKQQMQQREFEFNRQVKLMELRMDAYFKARSQAIGPGGMVDATMPDFSSELNAMAGGSDIDMTQAIEMPQSPLDKFAAALERMAAAQAEEGARRAQTDAALMQGQATLMQYMAAPVEIIRDEKNRVAGSRKVLQ